MSSGSTAHMLCLWSGRPPSHSILLHAAFSPSTPSLFHPSPCQPSPIRPPHPPLPSLFKRTGLFSTPLASTLFHCSFRHHSIRRKLKRESSLQWCRAIFRHRFLSRRRKEESRRPALFTPSDKTVSDSKKMSHWEGVESKKVSARE